MISTTLPPKMRVKGPKPTVECYPYATSRQHYREKKSQIPVYSTIAKSKEQLYVNPR